MTYIVNYNGIEIDMLSVGSADCMLVTRWTNGNAVRVLIDGGKTSHTQEIESFFAARNITRIHHLVNTHLDADHAGGLIGLVHNANVEIDKAWMHIPSEHLAPSDTSLIAENLRRAMTKHAKLLTASLKHSSGLLGALRARGIPVEEPFVGCRIGFMTVCGPTVEYYEKLLKSFKNFDTLLERTKLADLITEEGSLLDRPTTSAENNSSCILATTYDGLTYLFTADAGAEALRRAISEKLPLNGLHWMQVPHHGSRNNITGSLVEHFKPSIAYVSANGSDKHPAPAVIAALKRIGADVYGTHHPFPRPLWYQRGSVPPRSAYQVATPL